MNTSLDKLLNNSYFQNCHFPPENLSFKQDILVSQLLDRNSLWMKQTICFPAQKTKTWKIWYKVIRHSLEKWREAAEAESSLTCTLKKHFIMDLENDDPSSGKYLVRARENIFSNYEAVKHLVLLSEKFTGKIIWLLCLIFLLK